MRSTRATPSFYVNSREIPRPLRTGSCLTDRPMTAPKPRFRKILLKMSGEVLMGDSLFGIDTATPIVIKK